MGPGVRVAAVALSLLAAACSTDQPLGSPTDPEVVPLDPDIPSSASGEVDAEPSQTTSSDASPRDANEHVAAKNDARCLALPQKSPIGGIELLVTNVGDVRQEVNVFRDGELQVTVTPEPGGMDPKLADRDSTQFDQTAYHTDFAPPLGASVRYVASTGTDPAEGDLCGVIEVPETWPAPSCEVQIIDGYPSLLLAEGFGIRSYRRNGEPITLSTPPGVGENRLFDADPPIGVRLNYSVISDNNRWPQTVSDCGDVTIASAPIPPDRLVQAQARLDATLGPFWYTTISPICPSCEADDEITYAFAPDQSIMGTWRNGFEVEHSSEPWRVHPQQLATHLITEREAGREVEVEFDGNSTTITRWTVDGVGAEVLCESVDTASLALRTPFCNPEFFD